MIAEKGSARASILETSFLLFLAKGYDATSMSDIVRETGMSKGALYHHFTSKDELFAAAIRSYFIDIVADSASPADGFDGFEGAVRAASTSLTDALTHVSSLGAEMTAYYRFLTYAIDRHGPEVQRALSARLRTLSDAAERDARSGARRNRIAPGVLADMALATIEGAALLGSMEGPERMVARVEDAVDQFLATVRAAER
ncbi:helix-turn-helix domain-containing protein [Microbacterium sp. A8/3-1]|uniref:Helix-turn-helix domain-containing protein n=1 Tax=Microbacterium sp. A8/3-1 TaxID=3160749 RepID=A0AAU7VTV1_9MICO